MSMWKRVRALFRDEVRSEFSEASQDDESAELESVTESESDPLEGEVAKLIALGERDQSGSMDTEIALEAFDRLCAAGREILAIDLARRVLAKTPSSILRTRVAHQLDARGEDEAAAALLESLVTSLEAPLEAWMLAAEIAERRGHVQKALSIYEKIVARDVDYPRARERAQRLRESVSAPRAEMGATLMMPRSSTRGRYELVRELGRGGAGTIYLANDRELGHVVALKVYGRRGRADRERLLKEARMAASLQHPSVIRILDVDLGLYAIAMELIEHGSIRARLSQGRVPRERLAPWMKSAVEALRYVHSRGIVHCDLKPSNMLLRNVDCVVLTDFGIAKKIGEAHSGQAEGTIAYMSPEQRAGASPHPAMDVHALGATLRELSTHLDGTPPASLVEIAEACLRTDPTQRPRLDEVAALVSEWS
jgi:serine/threonine-protein kinase